MSESTSMQSTATSTHCEAGEPRTRGAPRMAGSMGRGAPRTTEPPGLWAARGAGAAGAPQCLGFAWAGGRGGRPVHGLLELRLQATLEIECLQCTRTSLYRLARSHVTMQFSDISGALGRSLHGLPPPDSGAARLDSFEDSCLHAFEI